jgi:hypothetical protein
LLVRKVQERAADQAGGQHSAEVSGLGMEPWREGRRRHGRRSDEGTGSSGRFVSAWTHLNG